MRPNATATLTSKQIRAMEVLLRSPSVDDAARAARVNASTIWRWLQQPAFANAYRDARSRLLDQTITALQAASLSSVTSLVEVRDDPETSAATKVAAASRILELTMKSREMGIEDRLRAIEEAIGVRNVFRPQGKWPRDDAG